MNRVGYAGIPAGTWTIIHVDGKSTTIQTIPAGDDSTEPEVLEEDGMIAFHWVKTGGRVRIFPLDTIMEINYVPETEDE